MYAHADHYFVFPRWLVAAPIAAAVTLVLFSVMLNLIFTDFVELDEVSDPINVDLRYKPTPIDTFKPEPIVEKPKVAPTPNEKPEETRQKKHNLTVPQIEVAVNTNTGNFTPGMSNIPIAQYLVQAKYPSTALRRNIEGYVDVRFDISKIGVTQNIEVIAAQPEGVFEQAAIDAVERWRYTPPTENGEAQPFVGISKRIKFEIGK